MDKSERHSMDIDTLRRDTSFPLGSTSLQYVRPSTTPDSSLLPALKGWEEFLIVALNIVPSRPRSHPHTHAASPFFPSPPPPILPHWRFTSRPPPNLRRLPVYTVPLLARHRSRSCSPRTTPPVSISTACAIPLRPIVKQSHSLHQIPFYSIPTLHQKKLQRLHCPPSCLCLL